MSISNMKSYPTDRVTDSMQVINTDHSYIHRGIAFRAHINIVTLNANTFVEYSFKTPANKYIHLKDIQLSSIGASVSAGLFRGTLTNPLVIDSAGTTPAELIGGNNVNDNSQYSSEVLIKKTPTFVSDQRGEVWDRLINIGSSTNQVKSVSSTKLGENFELVMKPDTYYTIMISNNSAPGGDNASGVYLSLFWYEEGDG